MQHSQPRSHLLFIAMIVFALALSLMFVWGSAHAAPATSTMTTASGLTAPAVTPLTCRAVKILACYRNSLGQWASVSWGRYAISIRAPFACVKGAHTIACR